MADPKRVNAFPKLHNAMWPGLVGKGSPGAEPCIDLDTMLDLTAQAEVNGIKFDGVDIFLFDPHVNIDSSDDDLKRLADKIAAKGLVVGQALTEPASALVSGPRLMLEKLSWLATEPVVVDGLSDALDARVAVRPPHPLVRILEPLTVRVVVTLKPSRNESRVRR